MRITKKRTKSLLWGKYSHSVQVYSNALSYKIIRVAIKSGRWDVAKELDIVKQSLEGRNSLLPWERGISLEGESIANFTKFYNAIIKYQETNKIERIRIEYNTCTFYSNNSDLITYLQNHCPELICTITQPDNLDHEQKLIENAAEQTKFKIKTVKSLPGGIWRYKINFWDTSRIVSSGVGELLLNYHEYGLIEVPTNLMLAIKTKENRIHYGRYIRIKDEDTLGIIGLALGQEHLRDVEEYRTY